MYTRMENFPRIIVSRVFLHILFKLLYFTAPFE